MFWGVNLDCMIRAVFLTITLLAAAIAAAPPGNASPADPYAVLWDLMPAGYDAPNCSGKVTQDLPGLLPAGAVAAITCVDSEDAPLQMPEANFTLFADQKSLANRFTLDVDLDREDSLLTPCPGGIPSPSPWHKPESPTVVAGQIACIDSADGVSVYWTQTTTCFTAFLPRTPVYCQSSTTGGRNTAWQAANPNGRRIPRLRQVPGIDRLLSSLVERAADVAQEGGTTFEVGQAAAEYHEYERSRSVDDCRIVVSCCEFACLVGNRDGGV